MLHWIQQYKESDKKTKVFIWNWVVYSLILVATTVYVYGRLDFVRTAPEPDTEQVIEGKK